MKRLLFRFLGVLLLAWSALPALAHDLWILPSEFLPKPGDPLTVRLLVGMHFSGEAIPRHEPWIQRFAWMGPQGEKRVLGMEGGDPVGIVFIQTPGAGWILYESTGSDTALPGDEFQAYLADEGLDEILRLREARAEKDKAAREIFYRCAKAFVWPETSPSPTWDQPLGLTLELVPESSPTLLAQGMQLSVRLLYQGQPLPGALVMALNQADPKDILRERSGPDGHVAFHLPRKGRWLVKAVHMIPARAGKDADYESYWASLIFELP